MADFEKAFSRLIYHEGGYVNDPDDLGGETKYGITKRAYPYLDIKNLTIEDAKRIYFRDYWGYIRGDDILNQELANKLFDASVNMGKKRAVMLLQQCVCVFKEIAKDGIMGEETLTAINQFKHKDVLIKLFDYERIKTYLEFVRQRPLNKKFLIGWLKRV